MELEGIVFVEPKNEYYGKNGQVYCDFTKSGKHYIYAHFEKDTNNLFYIGLGKFNRCNQVKQRNDYWKRVVVKHGLIIKFIEVELDIKDAIKKEKYYIKKYQPRANMTIGGEAGNNGNFKTKVYAYTKDGLFYKSFNSITEANVFLGKKENDSRITRCLKGLRKSFSGYVWKKEYYEFIDSYKRPPTHNIKKVYRYDLNGNFICKYDKVSDFKEGNATGISSALDTNYTYYNSFWRSVYSEKIEAVKLNPALKISKPVINTETGEIFKSISSAAKSINIDSRLLGKKLKKGKLDNIKMMYYE